MKVRNPLIISVFCLIVLIMATTLHAAPKLRIGDQTFDFGYTPEGQPVVHRYWIYSVGSDTLHVTRVRPSCGCTTVPLTKNTLAPGDSVFLDLKFDTKGFKGQIAKSATVESSDSTLKDSRLHFTANVGLFEGVVIANPHSAYLDTLGKTEQTLTLKNTSIAPYKISVVSPIADYMQCELSSTELPAKGEVTVAIRSTPKTPLGEYHTSVTFHFDGPQPHNITVPVFGVAYLP